MNLIHDADPRLTPEATEAIKAANVVHHERMAAMRKDRDRKQMAARLSGFKDTSVWPDVRLAERERLPDVPPFGGCECSAGLEVCICATARAAPSIDTPTGTPAWFTDPAETARANRRLFADSPRANLALAIALVIAIAALVILIPGGPQ